MGLYLLYWYDGIFFIFRVGNVVWMNEFVEGNLCKWLKFLFLFIFMKFDLINFCLFECDLLEVEKLLNFKFDGCRV